MEEGIDSKKNIQLKSKEVFFFQRFLTVLGCKQFLAGGNSNIFLFSLRNSGKISNNLTTIFFRWVETIETTKQIGPLVKLWCSGAGWPSPKQL